MIIALLVYCCNHQIYIIVCACTATETAAVSLISMLVYQQVISVILQELSREN